MKTELGKALAKLRLDLGMRQKVMAYRLGYEKSAFLSNIEYGDKKIPADFNERFFNAFTELDRDQLRFYNNLIDQQRGHISIPITNMALEDVSLVSMFTIKFSSLSVHQKDEIRILLNAN